MTRIAQEFLGDVVPSHDFHPQIEQFLLESAVHYPGIEQWWRARVVPGIQTGRRVCRVVMAGNEVVGLCIGKRGRFDAKLCTLRVKATHCGLGLGERLLRSTVSDLLIHGAQSVYFTISEEVNAQCGEFFAPYGFEVSGWKRGAYVKGVDEMTYSAPRECLQQNLDLLVLSIRPDFASLIEEGRKTVEFRRTLSGRFSEGPALFYVSRTAKEFRFSAQITAVVRDTPAALWERFQTMAGVSRSVFDEYFTGAQQGVALILDGIASLRRRVSLQELRQADARYRPPMSYSILSGPSPLRQLVSL